MDQPVLSLCFSELEESWKDMVWFGLFSCFLGIGIFKRGGKFRTTCGRAL